MVVFLKGNRTKSSIIHVGQSVLPLLWPVDSFSKCQIHLRVKHQPRLCSTSISISNTNHHARFVRWRLMTTCSPAPLIHLFQTVLLSGHQSQPSDTLTQSSCPLSCFAQWPALSQQEKINTNCLLVFLGRGSPLHRTEDLPF